tara:strand:- start:150 stop:374 length:225 start_codon:yes stop_codon:yes gene_type:complete
MNPRKEETVSVRVREATYARVKEIAKERGVKAVEIWSQMLDAYERVPAPTVVHNVTEGPVDANHRPVGSYMSNM